MTTDHKHSRNDDSCNTGQRCATCCDLIPAGSPQQTHSREIDDVIYHFCGPECYQRWQQRDIERSSSE